MSQLNLKQILSGDNLSTVVDKLNYNFNQIVLNGGGPQGLRGLLGAPGLPGAQGVQGIDGPKGETGTHIYAASGASPSGYPFGTGGEILPRVGDIFIETAPSFLNIWELNLPGTISDWNLVETILPPAGASKLVLDGVNFTNEFTNFSNDPAQSGKLLIGSKNALESDFIIDPSYPINTTSPRVRAEFSSASLFGDSLSTFVSNKNQIRILDYTRGVTGIGATGGGVVHSLETIGTNAIYRIVHGDTQGQKNFSLKLSSSTSRPTAIYTDTENRVGLGVSELTPLVTTTVINGGLAVGSISTNFYLASSGASLFQNQGAIIEGNVSIGRNKNQYATLGIYSRTGITNDSSVVIDSTLDTATSKSSLTLGGGIYTDSSTGSNSRYSWKFETDSRTTSSKYRSFSLIARVPPGSERSVLFSLFKSSGASRVRTGIDNTSPYGLFEIGPEESSFSRVSIGDVPIGPGNTANIRSYIGFNLHRNPGETMGSHWRRYGSTTELRSGSAIWSSGSGLGISVVDGTTGIAPIDTNDDTIAVNNTALYIQSSSKFIGINTNNPQARLDINGNLRIGTVLALGATATTFLTRDPSDNIVKSRTATQVRTDIGAIGGAGANGRVAYFNSGDTLTAENRFFWENSGGRLRVNSVDFTSTATDVKLDVGGQIRLRTGAAANRVLTSDANGNASWTDPSAVVASSGAGVPIGTIVMWGGRAAPGDFPSGWQLCNGDIAQGTLNAQLNTQAAPFGRDPSTNLPLIPDLRERFIVGAGSGAFGGLSNPTVDGFGYSVGASGGSNFVTLNPGQIPEHTHPATVSPNPHAHTYQKRNNGNAGGGIPDRGGEAETVNTSSVNLSVTVGVQDGTVGQSHENRPPFYALCFIIKHT